jgi:hypothetical protein
MPNSSNSWPALPYGSWAETYATLHMWTQVVGKVALALTPRVNHFWNIAMVITSRGLATHTLQHRGRAFTITFDFIDHQLVIECSDGGVETVALRSQSVADFYQQTMAKLQRLGVDVTIWKMPVEVPEPIRFDQDTVHHTYVPDQAAAFWSALVLMRPAFEAFRSRFLGKSSPVHFFWGSFDLASTRFSGRRAPERPGADSITREAYSHEVISHGFWPGGPALPEPVFYGYAAPEPDRFRSATVRPAQASYNTGLSEFILPYDAVRRSDAPSDMLQEFFDTTYAAGAELAGWNRAELERS